MTTDENVALFRAQIGEAKTVLIDGLGQADLIRVEGGEDSVICRMCYGDGAEVWNYSIREHDLRGAQYLGDGRWSFSEVAETDDDGGQTGVAELEFQLVKFVPVAVLDSPELTSKEVSDQFYVDLAAMREKYPMVYFETWTPDDFVSSHAATDRDDVEEKEADWLDSRMCAVAERLAKHFDASLGTDWNWVALENEDWSKQDAAT